jgi:hypothetical protein
VIQHDTLPPPDADRETLVEPMRFDEESAEPLRTSALERETFVAPAEAHP